MNHRHIYSKRLAESQTFNVQQDHFSLSKQSDEPNSPIIPPDLRHATEDRPISGKPELKAAQIVHF